jgi:hypothetical protein
VAFTVVLSSHYFTILWLSSLCGFYKKTVHNAACANMLLRLCFFVFFYFFLLAAVLCISVVVVGAFLLCHSLPYHYSQPK